MNKYQSSKAKTDCMTKEPITFDKLPQAVSYLTEHYNQKDVSLRNRMPD